jgi:hypothetical protein
MKLCEYLNNLFNVYSLNRAIIEKKDILIHHRVSFANFPFWLHGDIAMAFPKARVYKNNRRYIFIEVSIYNFDLYKKLLRLPPRYICLISPLVRP